MTGIEKSERIGNCIVLHLAKHATNLKLCGCTAQVTRERA